MAKSDCRDSLNILVQERFQNLSLFSLNISYGVFNHNMTPHSLAFKHISSSAHTTDTKELGNHCQLNETNIHIITTFYSNKLRMEILEHENTAGTKRR